jgi:hypothetical protein
LVEKKKGERMLERVRAALPKVYGAGSWNTSRLAKSLLIQLSSGTPVRVGHQTSNGWIDRFSNASAVDWAIQLA